MPNHLKNRRKKYLIDKPLQFRYMGWILLILVSVTVSVFISLYFGIWGQALGEFSDESVRNALQMTSRIQDYETARYNAQEVTVPRLAFIQETERFSQRQRDIIHEILAKSRRRLVGLGIPLVLLIALSTIFLSHKIAGPLHHLNQCLQELEGKNLTTRVHLRKFDETQKLAETFNEAVEALDSSFSKMKKTLQTRDPVKLRNEISKELSQFKTTSD